MLMQGSKILDITKVVGEEEINILDSFMWAHESSGTSFLPFRNIYEFEVKSGF